MLTILCVCRVNHAFVVWLLQNSIQSNASARGALAGLRWGSETEIQPATRSDSAPRSAVAGAAVTTGAAPADSAAQDGLPAAASTPDSRLAAPDDNAAPVGDWGQHPKSLLGSVASLTGMQGYEHNARSEGFQITGLTARYALRRWCCRQPPRTHCSLHHLSRRPCHQRTTCCQRAHGRNMSATVGHPKLLFQQCPVSTAQAPTSRRQTRRTRTVPPRSAAWRAACSPAPPPPWSECAAPRRGPRSRACSPAAHPRAQVTGAWRLKRHGAYCWRPPLQSGAMIGALHAKV